MPAPRLSRALLGLTLTLATVAASAQIAVPPALTFHNPALAARYPTLWRCVSPPAGWVRRDVTMGSMSEVWWCPSAASTCGDTSHPPDEYYEFRSLAGTSDERLELMARRRSAQGLTVTVSLQPWTGGFDLQFERGSQSVTFSATAEFTWRDQNLTTQPQHMNPDVARWLDAELARWLGGDRRFRDEGVTLMERLRTVVEASIHGHSLTTCDHPNATNRLQFVQTPHGEGAFDTCVRRPLTATEEHALHDDAMRTIDARMAFIRENYRAMYAALLETLPLDHCWTP